jgi:alpha-glucan phosphorylase-like protein
MASSNETGSQPGLENVAKDISHPLDSTLSTAKEHRVSEGCLFFDKIVRGELKEIITPQTPWVYWTDEIYRDDIKGQGGKGMLASDTVDVAKKLGIPMVVVTDFYTVERSNRIENFNQVEDRKRITPQERGFEQIGKVGIRTNPLTGGCDNIPLGVFVKKEGSVTLLTVSEPNIGELYQGVNNSNHRLYQEIALGFGGYKALQILGVNPSMSQQLNEAPTVFSALARLDDWVSGGKRFNEALSEVREKTIYTNHTLVQAVEAEFSLAQFEHFVLPNIKSNEVREWLIKKIQGKGNRIKLSTLALELAGKRNGVSKVHAREASKVYKDYDEHSVRFDAVTNGIAVDRWGNKKLLDIYRERGILDEYDLPTENYEKNLNLISEAELILNKHNSKERLRKYLLDRKDQYGKPVDIKEGVKIYNWRRRLHDYKRPGMLFDNPETLATILETQNADLVMAGNVHPEDGGMKAELKRILDIINGNETLRKRVHFIENYDENLGRMLSQGADVSINTPVVRDEKGNRISTEACGTSWMKDVLNNTILISTDDGGVADLEIAAEEEGRTDFKAPYLQITGNNYRDEVRSLYNNLWKASQILDDDARTSWGDFVKKQTIAYLPTISGARMEKDYINLGFPVATTIFIREPALSAT